MADENKKSPGDYQYPEEYSPEAYKPADVPPEAIEASPAPRGKRVAMLLGFLGAVIVVYIILSILSKPKSPTVQVTPVLTPPAPVVQAPAQPSAEELAMEKSLEQEAQSSQQTVSGLQSQVQQLQTQLAQLTTVTSTLVTQIQVLSDEVKALSLERSVAETKRMIKSSVGPVYFLKALVPGRAWLQTVRGDVATVTLGDRLAGYGIIQLIDTDQGVVTTSSGRIISYGPKDS